MTRRQPASTFVVSNVSKLSFISFLSLLALTTQPRARAEVIPAPGQGDSRIRLAPYSANEVYRLYGFVGYDIGLEFAPDERFKHANGGDLKALTYSAEDNVFTFKPRVRTVRMNFTVTTTKRRYYIQYTASDAPPDKSTDPVIYVVRFVYPNEPAQPAQSNEQRVETSLAAAEQTRPRNWSYFYCGRPDLRPLSAYDDGVHMRLTFAPRAELPAIFLSNADGTESLTNFTVEGTEVVIHRVVPRLILRRGRLTGCIVNKAFDGGSTSLDSGTVSPQVERVTKDPL